MKWLAKSLVVGLSVISVNSMADDTPKIKVEKIHKDLKNPWDMSFVDNDTMFFSEKCDGLSVKTKDGINKLYGMKGSKGYNSAGEDLFCEGQAGMMGIAVDPNFSKNRHIYVASTSNKYHGDGCKDNMDVCNGNIVMKFTVSEDFKSVSDRTDIITDIQYKPFESDHPFGGPGAHNGARLRFDKTGALWVTGGDRHKGDCPQSPTLICGKVLRVDTNGKAHPGNKPPKGFDKRIYTYGHRNVQGIAFHPAKNQIFTAEHGPWHNDEITLLVKGKNAGWDPAQNTGGRGECPDAYCGYMPNQKEGMDPAIRGAFTPMSDTRFKDLMYPTWNNMGLSQGTGSAAFLTGKQWGKWENRLVVGVMGIAFGDTPAGARIDVIDLTADGKSVHGVITMPLGISERFRGVTMGPDGALYAAVDEGNIYRITAE
tara:strand:- start:334 stop:1611 length:1278 start_codon:yes stop_codon:yes gene_type:complete